MNVSSPSFFLFRETPPENFVHVLHQECLSLDELRYELIGIENQSSNLSLKIALLNKSIENKAEKIKSVVQTTQSDKESEKRGSILNLFRSFFYSSENELEKLEFHKSILETKLKKCYKKKEQLEFSKNLFSKCIRIFQENQFFGLNYDSLRDLEPILNLEFEMRKILEQFPDDYRKYHVYYTSQLLPIVKLVKQDLKKRNTLFGCI